MEQSDEKRKVGRPKKYDTPEKAHEAQIQQMRNWRRIHKLHKGKNYE